MNISSKSILRFFLIVFIFGIGLNQTVYSQNKSTIQANYSVNQCDSLIQVNTNNPDFVILDVRFAKDYTPDHLVGAINRNYYAPNFSQLLDALPRHKMYLIHCLSGGRSGATFNMMLGMNFTRIINMLGGINSWKAASFPTTSAFAPLLMAVSDTMIANDTIIVGTVDTISLTITNRANDVLNFNTISSLSGTEFSTDFNIATSLQGAEDYTFSIFYEPLDELNDSINFLIESNGGDIVFHIMRTGKQYFVKIIAKAYLQGAYSGGGIMKTLICQTDSFPTIQPFNTPPWNYTGIEHICSCPSNVVDWVLIEVRDPNDINFLHEKRACLLLDNGQIVDTDYNPGMKFNSITDGYYYVVIRHLSHLPVMTANPVMLPNTVVLDFSDTTNTPLYLGATNSVIELEPNVYGMIGGDINGDGKLQYSGPGSDRALILQKIFTESGSTNITTTLSGYYQEDIKLDGVLKYSGPDNDPSLILQNLVNLTGSASITVIFSTPVPLP